MILRANRGVVAVSIGSGAFCTKSGRCRCWGIWKGDLISDIALRDPVRIRVANAIVRPVAGLKIGSLPCSALGGICLPLFQLFCPWRKNDVRPVLIPCVFAISTDLRAGDVRWRQSARTKGGVAPRARGNRAWHLSFFDSHLTCAGEKHPARGGDALWAARSLPPRRPSPICFAALQSARRCARSFGTFSGRSKFLWGKKTCARSFSGTRLWCLVALDQARSGFAYYWRSVYLI